MKIQIVLLIVLVLYSVKGTEQLLPPGKGGNIILNGKLELEAGSFPSAWGSRNQKPDYLPNGFPQGGGSFRFHCQGKLHVVRQDWTFSIVEGETYRLSYWVRSRDFHAEKAIALVFNNGWSKSAESMLPEGTTLWHPVNLVFTGFPSAGGVGSVGFLVQNIRQGEVEVADVCVEPATQKAVDASTSYLKEIPPQKLIPLVPKLTQIQNTLILRWFGEKSISTIQWFLDGKVMKPATVEKDGLVTLDLRKVKTGKHKLQLKAGEFNLPLEIEKISAVADEGNRKNNLHVQLFGQVCQEGKIYTFSNPRYGWVSIRVPSGLILKLEGMNISFSGSMPVKLAPGKYRFSVTGKSSGTVTVAAVAETYYYQLAKGPYLSGMKKHNYNMVKIHQLDCITTFPNGGPESEADWKDFREKHCNHLLQHVSIGDATADKVSVFTGLSEENTRFDGISVDEFSGSNNRQLAKFMKNGSKMIPAAGKGVYPWVTGTPGDSPLAAGFLSHTFNKLNGKVVYESYVPSNFTDEKEASKIIRRKLADPLLKFKKNYPGCEAFMGLALCHSNIPLTFSMDNEPEADFKYLMDMQMNLLANDPVFQDLSLVGIWGGNYADDEMTRWVSALFRHYVMEGKRDMFSLKYGFSLAPKHLKNCSFRKGLEGWSVSGKATAGNVDNFAEIIGLFNVIPGAADHYAILQPGSSISQTVTGLTPGRLYTLKYITSDASDVIRGKPKTCPVDFVLENTDELPEYRYKFRKSLLNPGTRFGRENYDIAVFRAKGTTAKLTLTTRSGSKRPSGIHSVSIMPYFAGEK